MLLTVSESAYSDSEIANLQTLMVCQWCRLGMRLIPGQYDYLSKNVINDPATEGANEMKWCSLGSWKELKLQAMMTWFFNHEIALPCFQLYWRMSHFAKSDSNFFLFCNHSDIVFRNHGSRPTISCLSHAFLLLQEEVYDSHYPRRGCDSMKHSHLLLLARTSWQNLSDL